jgi:NCS2 family nucleobase:cation symporter-2
MNEMKREAAVILCTVLFRGILGRLSIFLGVIVGYLAAVVLGEVTTALYGLIGVIGVKIWLDNKVAFSKSVNQFTAAMALIGIAKNYTFTAGSLSFNGIALGTVAAIVIYHLMSWVGRVRRTA